jgi:hypothetical protein
MLQSMGRAARAVVPVAAVLWAVSIVAAPWSDAMPGALGLPRVVGAATYLTGAMVCHQRADRSFHSHGVQWPVCERCSGLYLSAAIGVVFARLFRGNRPPASLDGWRTLLLASAVPTAATLLLEWWNPSWSSGLVRALAAAPLGAVAGALLAASMSFRGKLDGCERTR